MSVIPRSEHPRPQFQRADWICLNGEWEFEIDQEDSGLENGLRERELNARILVPFCPESELSGIGHVDFINAVWYRKRTVIPSEWAGKKALLHFQAVDYDATVWVNGVELARHRGGWTPFSCDLDGVAAPGEEAEIVVRARDLRGTDRPAGKQSNHRPDNAGCHYTRTTGIWQTVWMEAVPKRAQLLRPRITPDYANSRFIVVQPIRGDQAGLTVRAVLSDENYGAVAGCSADLDLNPTLVLDVPPDKARLWSTEDPHLYDLNLTLLDESGAVVDEASSYAGLRGVSIDGPAVKINGKPVFQRLVLDQGYYPDGIMTAPTDEALIEDIELSIEAGFNGARLHQKVFEERFLYHADRLGYLCWGEFGDWGINRGEPRAGYITEWLEVLERDYSHPSIVGWCPLNETGGQSIDDRIGGLDDLTRGLFLAAKAIDQSRPVLDTSGYAHRIRESDIYDCHDYDQNPESFKKRHDGLADGNPHYNGPTDKPWSIPHAGQPFFVSEFGGTWWQPQAVEGDSWGYGKNPENIEEFYERFDALCAALLDNPLMFAYCYTQLTDIFQEQNGIYHFDRAKKFDMKRIREAQRRIAAIEKT